MPMTLDDDLYDSDLSPSRDDEGPALRPDYVPLPPLENGGGAGTFGAGIGTAGKDPETFLTLKDPSRSTIDWNRFIRPATPEEIKAYDEWEARRAKLGMGAVISQVFEDRRQAWEQTPDQAAHRLWLERQTGISQRMLRDPDVLRTAELRAQMSMDALTLHDAPEQVVSWLKTPGMLEIARDDLETLKKIGDALQRVAASKAPTRAGGLWKGFQSGIANVMEGAADRREMQAAARMSPSVLEPEADVGTSSGVMGLGRGFLATLPKELRKDVSASMSRAALSNAEGWRGWADAVRPEPYVLPEEGTFYRWISDVAEATPYTLTGMPVSAILTAGGAALGGPLGATAGAALSSLIQTHNEAETEQAQVWRRLVDEGMDPAEAYDKSFNEVYLPNFGLLYLSNFLQDRLTFGVPLGRGVAYWAKRGGNFLLASLFEGAEEIGQSLIANRALGTANDWGQLLYEGLVGVGVGMVFGGGGAALDTAIGRYREHRSEGRAAQASAHIGAVMDEAAKAAEASKVRERSSEAFEDFVAYVGEQGQERVNVDGAVFFQTFGEDAAAAAERLGVRDQLEEAAQTGGAVEIPTAAILQNPDLYEKVKDDLRYSDDGMSRNEAREFERTRDERFRQIVDDAAAAERTVQEAGEKAERIRDGLRAQFEALGHKKVGRREAELYSTFWTAALANEARYAGMDIEEMARQPQWNVRFLFDKDGGVRPGREVYTHPLNPDVDLSQVMPVIDISGKMEDAQRATPQSLLAFLREEFIGQEPDISADAQAMIGLSSGNKARHVVRSSQRGLSYEDVTQRTAGLLSLREILQNARLIESHDNQKTEKELVGRIHRFFVPVWTGGEQPRVIRISAQEKADSDGQVPLTLDLYDVIMENQNRPPRLSAASPESAPTERQLRRPVEITIADMLRGVKDAEGRPYLREEYRQPLNPDVDLDAEIDDVNITEGINLPSLSDEDKWKYSKDPDFKEEVRGMMSRNIKDFERGVQNKHRPEMRLYLSNGGMNHIWDTAVKAPSENGRILRDAAEHLRELAENAYLVETHRDRYKDEGYTPRKGEVRQVHRFIASVSDYTKTENEQKMPVKHILVLTVKEMEDGTQEIGHLGFYDQKVGKTMPAQSHPQDVTRKNTGLGHGAVTAHVAGKTKIADAVRGVKDAEGRPYLREEYRQTSPRQSPDYDESDPKTWPPSAERDEAIQLEAWSEFDPDGEIESWPESPEKAEALELQKEYSDIEAWFDEHSIDEVLADEEHNARGVAIEERLRKLGRELKKKKPRGVEKRLSQLIEAEEEAAAREAAEAEEYYQHQAEAITREDVEAVHAIPRKSVNDFTPEEIRSSEKWAQKFWNELGVKSPFFRAWFGDWRAKDTTPVEIVAQSEAKGEMPRGTFGNDDTGWDILVSGKLPRETKGHSQRNAPFVMDFLGDIKQIIKNAVLLDTEPIGKENKQTSAFMHSLYTLGRDTDGRVHLLKLFVDEIYNSKEGDTFKRAYELKAITKTPIEANGLGSLEKRAYAEAVPTDVLKLKVSDLHALVKEYDPAFNPKDPSGVLDKNGRPLAVYHGTGDKFSEFRKDKLGSRESAFFFTSNKQYAAEYGNTLMPVYLNAKRFIRLDENYVDAEENEHDVDSPEFREQYDGYSIDEGTRWDEFAVFSPEQIKSASGNMGTFMPGDPNIYWQAEAKLAQDEKTWETLLDRFLNNELTGKEKGAPLPVMTTPLVLSLTGVEVLPVEIHARNLDKILNGKHGIAPETLKQIPRAITDPIMIFRSPTDESKGRDSRVILTELTEKDADGKDRNIVAAITLERANTRHGYEINELMTVFRKDISSKQQLTPELDIIDWMTRRHKDGSPMNLLLYLNRKKGLEWLDRTSTSPKASSPFQDPYVQSVPNEADLDKARGENLGYYQRQAEAKLAQDEKAWAGKVDEYLRYLDALDRGEKTHGFNKSRPIPVLSQTPLVFGLLGAETLPVSINPAHFGKVMGSRGKHHLPPELLKQVPRAMTEPVMVFRDTQDKGKQAHDPDTTLIVMLELQHEGKSLVVPFTLNKEKNRRFYNVIDSVYDKDGRDINETGKIHEDWFLQEEQVKKLLYLDEEKARRWAEQSDAYNKSHPEAQSASLAEGGPLVAVLEALLQDDSLMKSIKTKADLDKARTAAQDLYQDADAPLGYTRFEEAETIVAILKDGNRSTFLHELGHVLLNSRLRLALMEGLDDAVREDWTRLVEWLEVADIDFSKPLSEADRKRWQNAHEKFATGFEKYLMEGKAPSADLARAFRAFRKWLLDIYKAVRNIFYVDADGNHSQEKGQEKRRNHDMGVVFFLNKSSFLSGDRLLLAE